MHKIWKYVMHDKKKQQDSKTDLAMAVASDSCSLTVREQAPLSLLVVTILSLLWFSSMHTCKMVESKPHFTKYSIYFTIHHRSCTCLHQQNNKFLADFQYLFGLFHLPHKTKHETKMLNP
jgi:hypothetical protein